MANMSYCRFHNTLLALRDCKEALEEEEFPKKDSEEYWAMLRLIEVCQDIADNNDVGNLAVLAAAASVVQHHADVDDLREKG